MTRKILVGFMLIFMAVGAMAQMNTEKATFAAGCFWCTEQAFDKVEGVIETVSGYAGGNVPNPSYRQVSSGNTGHAEVLQVTYDPSKVSYDHLLYVFWRNVDPLDGGGQFCDRGNQYRPAIFYHNEEQRAQAEASLKELQSSGRFSRPIRVEITPLDAFYPAEDYHQNFYRNNPARYNFYVNACGRYARLDQVWGDEARAH